MFKYDICLLFTVLRGEQIIDIKSRHSIALVLVNNYNKNQKQMEVKEHNITTNVKPYQHRNYLNYVTLPTG